MSVLDDFMWTPFPAIVRDSDDVDQYVYLPPPTTPGSNPVKISAKLFLSTPLNEFEYVYKDVVCEYVTSNIYRLTCKDVNFHTVRAMVFPMHSCYMNVFHEMRRFIARGKSNHEMKCIDVFSGRMITGNLTDLLSKLTITFMSII